MIINFKNFLEVIKNNFFSIIFASIFISLSLSYLFFNISKSTVSKVQINILENKKGYIELIEASIALGDLSISHPINKDLKQKLLQKIDDFREYKDQEFSKMIVSISTQLDNSTIIKKNNKAKKILTNNTIVYYQLTTSPEVENEIKKIINKNYKNHSERLNSELTFLRITDLMKNFEKNHQDYLVNFKVFENKSNELFKVRDFCLVKCYNIKLNNLNEEEIAILYEFENKNKDKIELEYSQFIEKFDLMKEILNNLVFFNHNDNYNIVKSRAAPILTFYEIFLSLFLISFSLVSIFVLFKKSFDEEN